MPKGALKLETWEIHKIIPYVNNARTHSEEQVTQIASSIQEFGFTNPIQILSNGSLIAGHGRLMAAKKLGLNTIPAVIVDDLTDLQRKALIIADNKIALNAGWDNELLKIELQELELGDFDVDLLGFSKGEIDHILNNIIESSAGLPNFKEVIAKQLEHKCPKCSYEF